jgi:TPR repeat protein
MELIGAARYFKMAAAQGLDAAQLNYGVCLPPFGGRGVGLDFEI